MSPLLCRYGRIQSDGYFSVAVGGRPFADPARFMARWLVNLAQDHRCLGNAFRNCVIVFMGALFIGVVCSSARSGGHFMPITSSPQINKLLRRQSRSPAETPIAQEVQS